MIYLPRNEFELELNEINSYRVFFPEKLVAKHDEKNREDFIDDLILCESFEKWTLSIENKMIKRFGFEIFNLDLEDDISTDNRFKILIEALKLENYSQDKFMINHWKKTFLNPNNSIETCLKRFFCLMNDKFPNYLN